MGAHVKHSIRYCTVGVLLAIGAVAGDMAAAQSGMSYALSAAEVTRHRETGLVAWMSASGDGPLARATAAMRSAAPADAALSFLETQAPAFGLRNVRGELAATRTLSDELGHSFVRLQQHYWGVPIIGAELNVQLDRARNVVSVNGETVGDLDVSTRPEVTAGNARAIARRSTARAHRVAARELAVTQPSLAIHDARIMGGPPARPKLVWKVEVTSPNHPEIHELVLVDAANGRVAVQFNQQPHAAPTNAKQRICDSNNTSLKYPCTAADAVSNPGSSSVQDVKDAFRFAEHTFDFFARRFNRDSLDGEGMRIVSTVRHCPGGSCPYENAFWSSANQQIVYGPDFATADDVVGHEFGHGFTNHTSNLLYYYQSGAINESLSDIFGEIIDQTNGFDGTGGNAPWALSEDLPIGAIRNLQDPTLFGDPDRMRSSLWDGDFDGGDNGGVHHNSGVGNKTAYLMTEPGTRTFNGKSVTGIGIDKSAAIWHRVAALLLQSGSDYADVGNALKQACKDLRGTRPKDGAGNPSSSGKITKANCTEVGKAVAATELSKPPQYWPIPAEAPICGTGKVPTNKLHERFEGTPANFKFKGPDSHWFLADHYAASNHHSMGGADPVFGPGSYDTRLTQTAAVTIPEKAILRFAHFHNLYTSGGNSYAGGVVEYRIDNGNWKRVTPSMFTHNPYNATLLAGTDNPLAGQQAFSAFSGGWTSSRINLASLAGKSVRFRFRLTTNSFGAWDAWLIDDIRIFTCAAEGLRLSAN
jgi:Zn-dependent metalloprotease